jgi:hypothetical protein
MIRCCRAPRFERSALPQLLAKLTRRLDTAIDIDLIGGHHRRDRGQRVQLLEAQQPIQIISLSSFGTHHEATDDSDNRDQQCRENHLRALHGSEVNNTP